MKRDVVKKVASDVVELARERIENLLLGNSTSRPLKELLVNAYLQGAVDGASVEAQRAVSRGRYKRRGAA